MRFLPAILLLCIGCSKNEEAATPPAVDSAVEDTADSAVSPWKSGPYGTKPRDVAGPFVVPTTSGGWSFEERFTGEDHYLFVVYRPANPYSKGLFKTTSLQKLLTASPPNAHYFFLYADGKAEFDAFADGAQAVIPEEWRERVHFVTTPAGELEGWLGDTFRDRDKPALPYERYDSIHFAVDRTQHVREVGMLGRLGGAAGVTPDLSFLAAEPVYYEFEYAREKKLAEEKATVVDVLRDKTLVDEGFADIDLPSLAAFDTLEVDLTMNCENHRDGECGAWDYLADMKLCEGSDEAGAPKCDLELARWITTYWREGRWVTDISGMLPLLGDGGKKKLRFWASKQWDPRPANYVVSLSLRFSNRAKGMRPFETRKLFEGAPLNANYNDKYPPLKFTIPDGTKKTELYALITGHGAETGQCAEFCNHTHHFTLNGGTKHSLTFPMAQSLDGCRKRVNEGVVPNQHGTWYFGRGGWCPGLDVRPFLADMTADAKVGLENTLSYQALIGTMPPEPMTPYGNVHMTTYLVFWR